MLFRDKKGRLLAGLELGNSISQLSYCYSDRTVPETVSTMTGQEKFSIPTVLGKRSDVNQWFWGEDALSKEGDDVLVVKNLLQNARAGENVTIESEEFAASSLLALFVKRCLSLVNFVSGGPESDYLMITCDHLDATMIDVMTDIMDYLGMDREHFFYQGHAESFYQYVMHLGKEFRGHELLLLDSRDGLMSMRMEMNLQSTPMVSMMTQQVHDGSIMDPLPEDESEKEIAGKSKDDRLLNLLHSLCEGRIVTSVFLIGEGFGGGWMQESLRYMCANKRVFQGNNLYSKGACYGAVEKVYPSEVSQKSLFLGSDKVKSNVGVLAVVNGKEEYYPLLDAGQNWFDIHIYHEFVLEEDAAVKILITPLNGREKRQLQMILENFPQRPPLASRISLEIDFENENHMKLTVKDLGFGELFKKTDYVVEDIIEV